MAPAPSPPPPRRAVGLALGLSVAAAAAVAGTLPRLAAPVGDALTAATLIRRAAAEAAASIEVAPPEARGPAPVRPTGLPPSLSCDQARAITAQVERSLAGPLPPVSAERLGEAIADWLDPHGLWSAAPDAPPRAAIQARAARLLEEITLGEGRCAAAEEIGAGLAAWVGELRGTLSAEAGRPRPAGPTTAGFRALSHTPFEDGEIVRPARQLARQLGAALGEARAAFGPGMEPFVESAIDRLAPDLPPSAWAGATLAAATRALVPLWDPHGAWAPADETFSIYDVGLEGAPPATVWEEMTRTPLGIRIDRGARPPLQDGDVVLSIAGVHVAGLAVEQANQLAVVPRGAEVQVLAMAEGDLGPRALSVGREGSAPVPGGPKDLAPLRVSAVPYGDREVSLVAVPEVPDDLGDRIERVLEEASVRGTAGVVLDLRGNGGGSTDGALEALAPLLPGAPLFPMRRRDGSIEIDRAPLPIGPTFDGPVAVLVDEQTASAAEMIAAALGAYGRGPVVGRRTYGKGCAQEYLDDDAGAGLLRLTTLVFAGPDGRPLQRTGVVPDVLLGPPEPLPREDSLPHALAPWRGPDVRGEERFPRPAWPSHGGRVGPCADPEVCRALVALGAVRAAAR